ncbi:MAG: putative TIM-barrel fold metal-dependent hydrolase [Saprospiraceae bacterium]|jgi:predicted TIM-barrel fold metal-dependent hydrolase
MKNLIYLLIVMMGLLSCNRESQQKEAEKASVVSINTQTIKKIDVHVHFKQDRDYLPAFLKKWNMQAVLIDVAIEGDTKINRSWDEYVVLAKSHPELFWLCSSLIGVNIDKPDFAEKEIIRLTKEISDGAKMVKVWKNFGMVTKDKSGSFIQIDDERLQPIWDFLISRNIPVIAHIGEPVQAWRPLDDPKNPHFGYYTDHPEYHAYKHSEIPSYETITLARDTWIESNPELQILCAHMGSMSHDVNMIAERLERFPNMYVEPAARFGDLAGQDSKIVKAFFEKYQDRIFFGTDYGNSAKQSSLSKEDLEKEYDELDASYNRLWKYLSSTDSLEIRNQKTVGLELPPSILHKVYYQNVAGFLKLE